VAALTGPLSVALRAAKELQPAGEDDPAVLDLLFASSGIESEIVAAADTLAVVPGLTLPVATTGHLLATCPRGGRQIGRAGGRQIWRPRLKPGSPPALRTFRRLKVLSRDDRTRPQDVADLRALLRVATPKDLSTARSALALIQQRGFHRNRSLGPELDRAIAEAR
jgi:hypothetical protein